MIITKSSNCRKLLILFDLPLSLRGKLYNLVITRLLIFLEGFMYTFIYYIDLATRRVYKGSEPYWWNVKYKCDVLCVTKHASFIPLRYMY